MCAAADLKVRRYLMKRTLETTHRHREGAYSSAGQKARCHQMTAPTTPVVSARSSSTAWKSGTIWNIHWTRHRAAG